MNKARADNQQASADAGSPAFGVVLSALALLALFVWFPSDIKGGFVGTNYAGKTEPGDAFFPVLLACTIFALGLVSILLSLSRQRPTKIVQPVTGTITLADVKFLCVFHAIVLSGLGVMFWLGPAVVEVANGLRGTDATYRQLIDTPPYKYIGYVAGGGMIATCLIAWTQGGFRIRSFAIVLAVLGVLIGLFDGLLTNVQLPPNADY